MDIKNLAQEKLRRPATGHKGTFGRVFILAGSRGMAGAAHLAGMGALRSGAGLVTVGVPDAVYLIIAKRESELMIRPLPSTAKGTLSLKGLTEIKRFCFTQQVLALGPGLSQHATTQQLIRRIIQETELPVVIDAGSWKPGFDAVLRQSTHVIASADFRPPGCRDEVVSASTVRLSGSGPPSRWPMASPMTTNASKAASVPWPIRETMAGIAVNRTGMTAATRVTEATREIGLAIRSAKSG